MCNWKDNEKLLKSIWSMLVCWICEISFSIHLCIILFHELEFIKFYIEFTSRNTCERKRFHEDEDHKYIHSPFSCFSNQIILSRGKFYLTWKIVSCEVKICWLIIHKNILTLRFKFYNLYRTYQKKNLVQVEVMALIVKVGSINIIGIIREFNKKMLAVEFLILLWKCF